MSKTVRKTSWSAIGKRVDARKVSVVVSASAFLISAYAERAPGEEDDLLVPNPNHRPTESDSEDEEEDEDDSDAAEGSVDAISRGLDSLAVRS